jgi:hypothetical protein
MAPPPTLNELIATVQQDSPSSDTLDLLITASRTVTELSTVGDSVLDYFVAAARRDGKSWTDISSALGVSKQAAHKRFSPSGFERFTDRARHTIEAAVQSARSLGHPTVDTEHLLLAQFTEPQSIAARILAGHGITQAAVEEQVLAAKPRDEPISDEAGFSEFTPEAAEAVSGAVAEALQLGHNYIGTEHILLALYRDPESLAPTVLTLLGLTKEQARAEVIQILTSLMNKPKG